MKVKDIIDLVNQISEIKKIDVETIKNNLILSFEKAYLKEYPDVIFKMEIDLDKQEIKAWEEKTVVEDNDEIDDDIQITLEDAQKVSTKAKLGEIVKIPVYIEKLDRRVAVHVKQLFEQKISEQSNVIIYKNWSDKIGQNIRAEVENDHQKYIEINLGDTKGALLKQNQIPNENIEIGKKYIFYIKDVKEQTKGWPIILSRADEGLVKNLLNELIPEISNGIIEIKSIARIPGFKTKVAVKSNQDGVDPIGTCVGPNGSRIKEIMNMINNEYIDIILWDEDPKQFLVNACAPESLIGVEITKDEESNDENFRYVTLVVADGIQPKIIGKNGMNIKLISKLTGWSIDVVEEKIAKEDQINYEIVSHLVPTKPISNKFNFDDSLLTNKNKANKTKKYNNNSSFDDSYEYVTIHNNYQNNNFDITDDEIESLINFNSVPSKKENDEKEAMALFEEDFFKEEKSDQGPKHKKAKSKNKINLDEDTNNLFEELGDFDDNITINQNDTINDEEIGSDNLELDEE